MGAVYAALFQWAVPLWCGLIFFIAYLWTQIKQKPVWVKRSCAVMMWVALDPMLPIPVTFPQYEAPTQVVYRFDDQRSLELNGWGCEGALWYVDTKQGIRTEAAPQAFQIFFFTYVHPSTNYIAIPSDDLSAIIVSHDGGRTFHWNAEMRLPWDTARPTPDQIKRFVVVNDQGFFETKDDRLIESSKPFGKGWGNDYVYADGDATHLTYYDLPQFQNLPKTIPEVKNYTGWTHMQCDPNLGMDRKKTAFDKLHEALYAFFSRAQEIIFRVELCTLALPVYFFFRAL